MSNVASPLPTYDYAPAPLGTGRRAAVLGSPIAHSLSPVMHQTAYAELGLRDWVYDQAECDAAALPAMLAALDEEWAGLSLTMPLKQAVMAHLDVIEPQAEVVGGVNTVIVQHTGASRLLIGANTDVHGIVAALREVTSPQWAPRRAVILGAGATAASTLAALAQLGITGSTVLARNPGRAAPLQLAAHRMGVTIRVRRWSDHAAAARELRGADVVISTLPAGAADELAGALDATLAGGGLADDQALLDVVYDPWPTPLARSWQRAGGTVASGALMLLHQGAEQVRLMTGRIAPIERMRVALDAEITARAAGPQHVPAEHSG